jgi:hypothetical protein
MIISLLSLLHCVAKVHLLHQGVASSGALASVLLGTPPPPPPATVAASIPEICWHNLSDHLASQSSIPGHQIGGIFRLGVRLTFQPNLIGI